MQKAKGGQPAKNPSSATTGSSQRTLTDLGITCDQSSNWQKLAHVPEEEFESQVAAGTSTESIIAHHDIQERGGLPNIDVIDDGALWLCRLLDFECDAALDRDANELLTTMHDHQSATVLRLAPVVAAWLGGLRQ
jgi:hypothetical protein